MKFEEILKQQGLNEEQISTITAAMKTNKLYTTSLENAEVRYNKLKEDKKDLETQLNTANTAITDFKKLEIDNEDLKTKINDYEVEKSNYEKALADKDFNYSLDKALSGYKCKNSKLIKSLLDKEKLKVNGDDIIGFKDQMESIKKEYEYLFEKEVAGTGSFGTGGINGGSRGENKEHKSIGEKLGQVAANNTAKKTVDDFFNN